LILETISDKKIVIGIETKFVTGGVSKMGPQLTKIFGPTNIH